MKIEMSLPNSSSGSLPGGASSTRNSRMGKELCYLCDLPRMPWAMIHDFSGTCGQKHKYLCKSFMDKKVHQKFPHADAKVNQSWT